jgi:putative DNA methylase
MTRRLIEVWLPIAELGEESVRERRSMTALPPIYYLHVWWARRPLIASRAAILASILPEDSDHDTFMQILGIHGDPVSTKMRIEEAKRTGENLGPNIYGYPRAFSYLPNVKEKKWIKEESKKIGLEDIQLLDPTAGGGSIPLESIRLGINTQSNDLNPVASVIIQQTIKAPLNYGETVLKRFDEISEKFIKIATKKLNNIFPAEPNPDSIVEAYLWAHTIKCPFCLSQVPLAPNWRLAPNGTGIKLIPNLTTRKCEYEIVFKLSDQSQGTVTGGDANCPYSDCGRIITSSDIKKQALEVGLGNQLYCIVIKEPEETFTQKGKSKLKLVRKYRLPNNKDDNLLSIQEILEKNIPEWEAWDFIPTEKFPEDANDTRPIKYGMTLWRDQFNFRQLFCHVTSIQVYRELLEEYQTNDNFDDLTKSAFVYLSFSIDKLLNYNSRMSRWNSAREVIVPVFDRHDFSFKWSYSEMPSAITGLGLEWAIKQTGKCLKELIELIRPEDLGAQGELFSEGQKEKASIKITCQSANELSHIKDKSIDLVVMDPPYYNNVMYAELSDFFYVWLKRTAGYVYPEFFRRTLTDKENEAVANPAKFLGEKRAKSLAGLDYQDRMAGIFKECRRVLNDNGILTLMFTHKATGAWDALTKGLLDSGFTITASWPIKTEAESSLHIRNKAAANSTIFLVCRPRIEKLKNKLDFWEEVEPLVKKVVRERISKFQESGIVGVDLYLSCFGPALEEFAKHWPLQRGNPKDNPARRQRQQTLLEDKFDPYEVTPEDALDAARKEVKQWRMQQLIRTNRQTNLDPLTEWFVLAWDSFKSPQFPYDEGLRLARVVGIDLDTEIVGRIAEKKTSNLIIWDSVKRAAKGVIGPPDGSRSILDTLHHAAHRARTMNLEAARELLEESVVSKQPNFEASLLAVLEVLPVSSTYTKIEDSAGPVADAASDFDVLEHLRRLAFSEKVPEPVQLSLWK